ncbi:MAG: hypothetical protein LBG17_09535 [Bacteroidales bacterium]|jgi:hypothetical protein|nr:hypothetical protein [Bacteroidales bacterium]
MNKHFLIFFLFIVSVCTLSSCSSKRSAERVADKFLQAYYIDFDFRRCRALSTFSSEAAIAEKEELVFLNPFASEEESPKVELISTTVVEGRFARCVYSLNGSSMDLFLIKDGKKWLVDAIESGLSKTPTLGGSSGGFAVSTSAPRKKRQ